MGHVDRLAVVTAAYDFDRSEEAWVRGIVQAAAPFDMGLGVAAYIADLGERPTYRSPCVDQTTTTTAILDGFLSISPPAFWRRIHAAIPARWVRDVEAEVAGEKFVAPFSFDELPAENRSWGVIGGDSAETILLFFPCRERADMPESNRRMLDFIGAHMGAALRLRGVQKRAPTTDAATVEAVLSPSGQLLDARGEVAQKNGRTLTDAVKRVEHARSRKATPEERLSTWTALVEGRWSIVETTERDGKRMLLAMKNEPRAAAIRKLTPRESRIVGYAALGHSFKYIAYELGISSSTVSATVTRALRKLGLRSRADLIHLLG